jgi:hypothetical protein
MSQIEDTIVIQLAKFNDVDPSLGNAIWSNHTKQLVTINQGDQVLVSKSYIDTRDLTSSGIVILEDTPLELEMFFYWINDGNPGSLSTGLNLIPTQGQYNQPWWGIPGGILDVSSYSPPDYTVQITLQSTPNIVFDTNLSSMNGYLSTNPNTTTNSSQTKPYADGRPYLLCYTDNSPYTQTWKYTLPKGTYTPDALSSLLTEKMSEVKKNKAESLNKTNASEWFDKSSNTLDQPFIVNTNGSPPIWGLSTFLEDQGNTRKSYAIVNSQPNLQIVPNSGLPTNWNQGTTGTLKSDTYPGTLPTTFPVGSKPAPSLCFKNIISDCPIPNTSVNLPIMPNGASITADKMIINNYYEIATLGDTLWTLSGDNVDTPKVGDQFECTAPGTVVPDTIIPYYDMNPNFNYAPVYWGKNLNSGIPDTNWIGMGYASNTPPIGEVVPFSGIVNYPIIPSGETSNLKYIEDGITYKIEAYNLVYDWSALGGPSPVINPTVIPYTQMTQGNYYEIVDFGSPYGTTYTQSYLNVDTNWLDIVVSVLNIGNTNFTVCENPDPSSVDYQLQTESDLALLKVGNSITINDAGDVDWTTWGYLTQPIIPYTDMIYGQNYKIVTLGNSFLPNSQYYTYDTNWFDMGNTQLPFEVGQVFTNASNDNILISNNLDEIVSDITYTIAQTDAFIDWSIYGGPSNDVNEDIITIASGNLIEASYVVVNAGNNGAPEYVDTDWNYILGIPESPVFKPPVGFRFKLINNIKLIQVTDFQDLINLIGPQSDNNLTITIIQDTPIPTDWTTWGYSGAGPLTFLVIKIGTITNQSFIANINSTATIQALDNYDIPFNFTATNNGDSNGIQNGYVNYQAIVRGTGTVRLVPTIQTPFTFTITQIPNPIPANSRCSGFVNGTGTVRLIESLPTLPFTFTATSNGPDSDTYPFSGEIIGSGTVNLGVTTTQGTCFEILHPTSPNFYLYPLKLSANPTYSDNSSYSDGQNAGGSVINYTFPLVGSTEISLAYNASANIFQWDYTHSPIQQASAPASSGVPVSFTEVVGIVNSFIPDANVSTETPPSQGFVSSTCKLVSKSGCMFRKMEPVSFWQNILGFSPDLIVKDSELGLTTDGSLNPINLPADKDRFTYERFNSITTRSLLTSAMNFNTTSVFPNIEESYISGMFYDNPSTAPVQLAYSSVIDTWSAEEIAYNFMVNVANPASITQNSPFNDPYKSPPPFNSVWYEALATTAVIPAIRQPLLIANNYGHFLVEIQGYDGGGMLNESQKYNVKSIVSSYYVNPGSFTTGPFIDTQAYTHVGIPTIMNSFTVRILDPFTMQEVKGLGPNSCVYLQINKALSEIQQSQV